METNSCQVPFPNRAWAEATPRPVRPMLRPPATPENARARELRASSSRAVLVTLFKICGAERREVSMAASFVAIGGVRCEQRSSGTGVHIAGIKHKVPPPGLNPLGRDDRFLG